MASPLAERLRVTHPEYDTYERVVDPSLLAVSSKWEFWRDSFTGGGGYEDKTYVIKHPRESDSPKLYAYRQSFSKFVNEAEAVASDWISRLFGPGLSMSMVDPKERSASPTNLANEIEGDFDLLQNSMLEFTAEAASESLSMGMCGVFVQVHNPSTTTEMTLADAEEIGVRPFCRIVSPENIRNWEWDKNGRLKWALIREQVLPERLFNSLIAPLQPRGKEAEILDRYVYLDDRQIQVFEPTPDGNDYIPQEPLLHDLGRIPLTRIYWSRPKPREMFAKPLLDQVYQLQHLIYNLRSGLSELMTNQMFSLFVVGLASGARKRQEGDKEIDNVVGTSRGFAAPFGAGFPPFFASPDASIPEVHQRYIASLEKVIARISRKGPHTLVDDGKVQDASGRAKAFDQDEMSSFLRKSGDRLEPAFRELLTTVWKRSTLGTQLFSGIVKFPDSFLLRGSMEEAEETLAICQAAPESETACRIAKRRFVTSVLRSEATEEEMKAMVTEIEENPLITVPMQGDALNSPNPEVDLPLNRKGPSGGANGQTQSNRGAQGSREQPGPTFSRLRT